MTKVRSTFFKRLMESRLAEKYKEPECSAYSRFQKLFFFGKHKHCSEPPSNYNNKKVVDHWTAVTAGDCLILISCSLLFPTFTCQSALATILLSFHSYID